MPIKPRRPAPKRPPRLLDRVRDLMRSRHYSPKTIQAYVYWMRRFITFSGMKHPSELGEEQVAGFLSALAVENKVSASTQNQALNAIVFLYREVLGTELTCLEGWRRARTPRRLPVVLRRDEVMMLFRHLDGTQRMMAGLIYGAGLRLMECHRLRVKDIDFERNEILVRCGKGNKDRHTVLPRRVREDLRQHLRRVHLQHKRDLDLGAGFVELPGALRKKYPSAAREWIWQWCFPATRIYSDRETGERRRHHLHESVLQRAVKQAARMAGLQKRTTCHALRHHADTGVMPSTWLRISR